MSQLKIRLEINPGRVGAPLDKLAQIAGEAELFLRMLCEDVGLKVPKGEWLATNFHNNSVQLDAIHSGDYGEKAVHQFNGGLLDVANFDPDKQKINGKIRAKTYNQYAKLGNVLAIDEKIGLGIFNNGDAEPAEWRYLDKAKAIKISITLQEKISYYGSVLGNIHALFKGAKPQYFTLRERISGELISCFFGADLYSDVIKALESRNASIYAHGLITASRSMRRIDAIQVNKIKVAPILSDKDYRKFFGAAPGITGNLSTEQYIEEARDHD
ncbi:MAG: hypothetical protein KJ921_11410 [Proteobacteria bacterium]|nr:hypothetical protein [Pseudomonadota bacterium]